MKKTVIFITITVLFSAGLYALTGIAYITPEKVARSSYTETIEITYYPANVTSWNNGALEVIIPEEFIDLPTLSPGMRGEIKVYYLRAGSTIEPVLNSNILIDGRAITITAINMSSNDILKIVYGTKDNGGEGVQAPYYSGIYYFLMKESLTGTSSFISLDTQPFIEVTMIDLTKSANVTSIMAKNTFTYTITYKNISNMYPVDGVRIWDTLPQGLNFIYSDVIPTSQAGRYLFWNLGSLYYSMTGTFNIVVEAQPGIIEYGQALTNTAIMEASDVYVTYREEAEKSIDVFGVKLVSDIYASPSTVFPEQNFTVLMIVQNQGNYHAYNVSPSALTINGSGNAVNVSGPVPSVVSILSQNQTSTFTWVYRATGAGSIYFSGRTLGQENTLIVESNTAYSNVINLIFPTNTQTPVITFTNTPMHTKTFTGTPTQEITLTPTCTDTQQEAATPTWTNTEVLIITPTFTKTSTSLIDTPTFVKTIVPTATPDALVYIDKNYFNPEKGERVKIHYKVLEQGTVDIKIYNLSGEIIISYSKNYSNVTFDYFYWDGRNSAGKIAGKGIYFIMVRQKSQNVMKKIVVLK